MEKTIKIDGKETRMVANGATPRLYRSIFGKDVFADMNGAIDKNGDIKSAECFENLAYVMAKQGGLEMGIDEWLGGMESPTAVVEASPELLDLWLGTNSTIVSSKKK